MNAQFPFISRFVFILIGNIFTLYKLSLQYALHFPIGVRVNEAEYVHFFAQLLCFRFVRFVLTESERWQTR